MKRDRINIILSIPVKVLLVAVIVSMLGVYGALQAQTTNIPGLSWNEMKSEVGRVQSKDAGERHVTLSLSNTTLEKVLIEIARSASLKLTYSKTIVPVNKKIESFKVAAMPVGEALNKLLEGTKMIAIIRADGRVVITSEGSPHGLAGNEREKKENNVIKGRVIDSTSKIGIPGVMVAVIGTEITGITDKNGVFILNNVPINRNQISFKMLGYALVVRNIEKLEKGIDLVVALVPSATSLNEVVTTATGPQRRVEVAHDIAVINASEVMARSPVRSVADILEAAQVPGVQVQRGSGDPGAPTKIRIRGISSISQTNDPVVILDGIWIDAATSSPSKLDDIDPSTIEKIEVVRGPSAATLYGQDASNGVIVITTKKGKAGATRWNFTYNRDWGETYGKLPLIYFGIGYNPAAGSLDVCPVSNVNRWICVQDTVLVLNPNDPMVMRDGTELNNKYVVQIDGGSNSVTYAITGTVQSTAGLRKISDADMIRLKNVSYPVAKEFSKPSQLDRRHFTSRLDINPYKKITAGLTLTTAQTQLRDNTLNTRWGGKYYSVVEPTMLSYYADTSLRTDLPHQVSSLEKPISSNTAVVGGTAQYRPGHGVVINANVGSETITTALSEYLAASMCFVVTGCVDTTSETLTRRREQSINRNVYTFRLNTSTSLNLGKLREILEIRPSIGGDMRRVKSSDISIEKSNIPVADRSISSGTFVAGRSGHLLNENATAGWYLNSTIGIARRIYFDVGVRQDIGSAITSSSQYPKLGGSWLISDESFWKNNNYINLLRLRTAVGHAAVQPDVQDIYGSFVSSTEYIDGKFVRSAQLSGTGNSKLTSERATEIELGIDADIIYNRVNIAANYATSVNKNALQSVSTPASFGSGGSSRKENIARVSNKNLELSINSRLVENRTALIQLYYGLTLTENRVDKAGSLFRGEIHEGYPIGGVWTRKVLGYDDRNGNGMLGLDEVVLSDDLMYVGWSQPRYRSSYGINMTFLNQITFDSRFAYQSQYVKSVFNENVFRYGSQDIRAPLVDQAQEITGKLNPSKPVSDLRWNSASIQYQVPGLILRRINARSLSISLQGRNLGLWTNYVGRDPSINNSILTSETSSDNGLLSPPARLYVLDFKLGF